MSLGDLGTILGDVVVAVVGLLLIGSGIFFLYELADERGRMDK